MLIILSIEITIYYQIICKSHLNSLIYFNNYTGQFLKIIIQHLIKFYKHLIKS